ncbi:MAG: ankyrin repeat domain-containing protein, partial [Cytophagales bacterium]|nr:ankyrin repeat domain-containing protein [Cytophagales bacterium]
MLKSCLSIILVATLLVGACKNSNKGENAVTPLEKHDNKSKTTLIDAVEKGDFKEVKRLIEQEEADVNVSDSKGKSALHCAAERGHKELAAYLTEQGAAVDTADNDGNTPLHLAA